MNHWELQFKYVYDTNVYWRTQRYMLTGTRGLGTAVSEEIYVKIPWNMGACHCFISFSMAQPWFVYPVLTLSHGSHGSFLGLGTIA